MYANNLQTVSNVSEANLHQPVHKVNMFYYYSMLCLLKMTSRLEYCKFLINLILYGDLVYKFKRIVGKPY